MNQNNTFYCRMEDFCYHNLQNCSNNVVKEKSLKVINEDVYSENLNDISLLKAKIYHLSEIWLTRKRSSDNNQEIYEYPGFLIYNQWKDWSVVSHCLGRWYLLNSKFSNYVKKHIINLHDDKYGQYLRKIQGKCFDVFISVDNCGCEVDLLSDELLEIELKHFFRKELITEKIQQDIFYPEMVRRGYIDILNE